jgi:hypothetical protein
MKFSAHDVFEQMSWKQKLIILFGKCLLGTTWLVPSL